MLQVWLCIVASCHVGFVEHDDRDYAFSPPTTGLTFDVQPFDFVEEARIIFAFGGEGVKGICQELCTG